MSTLTQLQTKLARALRDTSNITFLPATLTDLINDAIIEIGRIAPKQFQEDVDGSGAQTYTLDTANADVRRVEVWTDDTPGEFRAALPNIGRASINASQSGWHWWNQTLYLPKAWADYVTSDYILRVWGYATYTLLANGSDSCDLGDELEAAALEYAQLEAYQRLMADRVLFQQVQAAHNATDVSLNMIVNAAAAWQQRWERRRRQLVDIRELG